MDNKQTEQFTVHFTEEQRFIRDTIKEFAESKIKPIVMEIDETQTFPLELMRELGKLGFLGILVPEKYGGAELGYTEYAIVVEEIAKIDPSVSLSVAAHNGLCTNHITMFGNETQKEKYLPNLTSGNSIGAWALTEPDSGTDAGALKTIAKKEGEYYVLNGTKNFITHGDVADATVVMAITNKSAGKKGISAFIVDRDSEGYIVGKKENKLGMRASETVQIIFDNCKVPKENLLGIEGDGFKQALKILEGGRISIAALSLGLAEGCLAESIKYSMERKQFGKPISDFQATQFKLAEMETEIETARLLTYKAASKKDSGEKVLIEATTAKLFASEIATKATNEAVQIFGGYGFTKDYPVEKFYRDVKLLTIGEGTSEAQRLVIGKYLSNI